MYLCMDTYNKMNNGFTKQYLKHTADPGSKCTLSVMVLTKRSLSISMVVFPSALDRWLVSLPQSIMINHVYYMCTYLQIDTHGGSVGHSGTNISLTYQINCKTPKWSHSIIPHLCKTKIYPIQWIYNYIPWVYHNPNSNWMVQ